MVSYLMTRTSPNSGHTCLLPWHLTHATPAAGRSWSSSPRHLGFPAVPQGGIDTHLAQAGVCAGLAQMWAVGLVPGGKLGRWLVSFAQAPPSDTTSSGGQPLSMEQEEGMPHVDFIQYIASAGDTIVFPSPVLSGQPHQPRPQSRQVFFSR